MNQFIWAQTKVTDVPFVLKFLEQSITCKIISEHILAKNHILAPSVHMQELKKCVLIDILPHITMILPNRFILLILHWCFVCWYYRMNQFMWAKKIIDAHFVKKDLEKSNICKIISEHILAKNHFIVPSAIMHAML